MITSFNYIFISLLAAPMALPNLVLSKYAKDRADLVRFVPGLFFAFIHSHITKLFFYGSRRF